MTAALTSPRSTFALRASHHQCWSITLSRDHELRGELPELDADGEIPDALRIGQTCGSVDGPGPRGFFRFLSECDADGRLPLDLSFIDVDAALAAHDQRAAPANPHTCL